MNFIRAALSLFIYFLVLGIPLMCLIALLKYVFKVKNVKRMQMHDNLIADFNDECRERNLKFLDDMKEVKRMLSVLDKDIENAKKDIESGKKHRRSNKGLNRLQVKDNVNGRKMRNE